MNFHVSAEDGHDLVDGLLLLLLYINHVPVNICTGRFATAHAVIKLFQHGLGDGIVMAANLPVGQVRPDPDNGVQGLVISLFLCLFLT